MLLKLTHPVISTGILGTKSRIADIQISSKQIKIHRTAVRLPCPDSGSASLPTRVCLRLLCLRLTGTDDRCLELLYFFEFLSTHAQPSCLTIHFQVDFLHIGLRSLHIAHRHADFGAST